MSTVDPKDIPFVHPNTEATDVEGVLKVLLESKAFIDPVTRKDAHVIYVVRTLAERDDPEALFRHVGAQCWVLEPTEDTTVPPGNAALYLYCGDQYAPQWFKLQNGTANDVLTDILVRWSGIQERPPVLDELGEDENNNLTFRGRLIKGGTWVVYGGRERIDEETGELVRDDTIPEDAPEGLEEGGLYIHYGDEDEGTQITPSSGEGAVYTNPEPTTETLGGLAAGYVPPDGGELVSNILSMMLHKYQNPSFTSFGISGQNTTLEVGQSIAANRSFSFSCNNVKNIQPGSITLHDVTGNNVLATTLNFDSSPIATTQPEITKTSATSHTWRIVGTNTNTVNFSKDWTVNWQWRIYYGESDEPEMTADAIKALRMKPLAGSFNGTFPFNPGGYKWFCYPAVLGTANTFIDTGINMSVPMQNKGRFPIMNDYNIATNYIVMRTENRLGGAITIKIS